MADSAADIYKTSTASALKKYMLAVQFRKIVYNCIT